MSNTAYAQTHSAAAGAAAAPGSSAFTFSASCDFLRAAVFLCMMPRFTFLSIDENECESAGVATA